MRPAALRAHRSGGVASQPKGLASGVEDPAAECEQQQGGRGEHGDVEDAAEFADRVVGTGSLTFLLGADGGEDGPNRVLREPRPARGDIAPPPRLTPRGQEAAEVIGGLTFLRVWGKSADAGGRRVLRVDR